MSTNEKILVVSGIYPPDIGGPATYVPQLCNRLMQEGYEISLISLQDNSETERAFEPWKRIFISREFKKSKRIFLTFRALYRESRGCQAIFANGLYEEVGLLKLMRPRIHFVAKIVGDPIWERDRNRNASSIRIEEFNRSKLSRKNLIQRLLLAWALNRFNKITCPSNQLAELIHGWNVYRPITVIANGVKCKEISMKRKKYDVVSVTRLVPWKNLDRLIVACARVNLSLAICGDGPEKSNLQRIAQKNKSDVFFLGQLDSQQVAEVIDESVIFALISSYEGLSFALLEAMMAGKQILASDCKGNIDVISNGFTGSIVDPNDEKQLENALWELIDNPAKAREISKNAHKVAKEMYCAKTQLDLMVNLLTRPDEK